MEEPPGSEERSQLISALLGTFFGSYNTQVDRQSEAYLSLDKGLSVLSKHAASLGYDALILFLDELILWLASRAADLNRAPGRPEAGQTGGGPDARPAGANRELCGAAARPE